MNHISDRETFLAAEDRDGVHVSAELKAVWKVMLDIFEEFVRICEKYDLHYCLDGGSILGAIRHKGFVPWDDDMDITLPRADFKKFLEVAPRELKKPLFCQYTTTDPRHVQGFLCIRNSATTGIDRYWADQKVCFNMGIGIDIFPLDDIPDEDAKVRRLVAIQRAAIQRIFDNYWMPKKQGVRRFSQLCCVAIYGFLGVDRLVALRDYVWGFYNGRCCNRCSTISYNKGRSTGIWNKQIFTSRVIVPFEYLDVYVPVDFNGYLDKHYGQNWKTPIRGAGDHGGLVLDASRPFKQVLRERFFYTDKMVDSIPE